MHRFAGAAFVAFCAWIGNAHADDPGAAELGFRIFFDSRFSSNQEVRCASCHASLWSAAVSGDRPPRQACRARCGRRRRRLSRWS